MPTMTAANCLKHMPDLSEFCCIKWLVFRVKNVEQLIYDMDLDDIKTFRCSSLLGVKCVIGKSYEPQINPLSVVVQIKEIN